MYHAASGASADGEARRAHGVDHRLELDVGAAWAQPHWWVAWGRDLALEGPVAPLDDEAEGALGHGLQDERDVSLHRRCYTRAMPFTASDAIRHTRKASTAKKSRQWAAVANSLLKSGKSEGAAIRVANAAVSGRKKKRR